MRCCSHRGISAEGAGRAPPRRIVSKKIFKDGIAVLNGESDNYSILSTQAVHMKLTYLHHQARRSRKATPSSHAAPRHTDSPRPRDPASHRSVYAYCALVAFHVCLFRMHCSALLGPPLARLSHPVPHNRPRIHQHRLHLSTRHRSVHPLYAVTLCTSFLI